MMTPFLAFYLTLMGGEGIPSRTHAAAEQIAQNYGEGAAFVGLGLTPAATADSGVAAASWLSTTNAVWLFEEAAEADATDSGASGDDTLADNPAGAGGVGRDTANYVEGAQSADVLVGTTGNWFTCADASCPGLDFSTGASLTEGCWIRFDTLPDSALEFWFTKSGTNVGWNLYFVGNSAGDPFRCRVDLATDVDATWDIASFSTDTWYHVVCTLSDPGDITLTPYVNAAADTAGTGSAVSIATNNNTTYLGSRNSASQGLDGRIDECFHDSSAWSAAQVAYACSCGIAGSKCRCETGTQANYLPCDSNTDCQAGGGAAICDTAAGAKDDTYCVEGSKAGCCMGRNATGTPNCGGVDLTACNATGP